MLTIFEKIALLSKKTGKTPDFIQERLGITPEIEKELRAIDEIETVDSINKALQDHKKSHGIVYVELCTKYQYLNAVEEAAAEILRLGNKRTTHNINLLVGAYVNSIQ